MMKSNWLLGFAVILCSGPFGQSMLGSVACAADDPITISVDSLANVNGSGALEACGTAVHKQGTKPLMITVKHDESFYTILTGPNDKWCVVFKRWTFDGKIDVSATTLQKAAVMNWRSIDVSKVEIQ